MTSASLASAVLRHKEVGGVAKAVLLAVVLSALLYNYALLYNKAGCNPIPPNRETHKIKKLQPFSCAAFTCR